MTSSGGRYFLLPFFLSILSACVCVCECTHTTTAHIVQFIIQSSCHVNHSTNSLLHLLLLLPCRHLTTEREREGEGRTYHHCELLVKQKQNNPVHLWRVSGRLEGRKEGRKEGGREEVYISHRNNNNNNNNNGNGRH